MSKEKKLAPGKTKMLIPELRFPEFVKLIDNEQLIMDNYEGEYNKR